ncbi:uncharacterized protein LOC123317707 [Coccinella septempunctata]|uniref:uncharacterized protein LOC123317707 n=1 Tax=Coccinella septempunctata TaxID=41139 RepID=UPI001D071374|nr:uncharacterized protein LOC123317707 [Coccinella septempunctata]
MDKIIQRVKKAGKGYRLSTDMIKIVCFADDVISDNEDDLQRMAYEFKLAAEEYNMIISISETKSLVIAREPKRCKIVINNEIIEQVSKFEYLGVEISDCGGLKAAVRKQANKAAYVSGCLRDVIWRNKDLRLDGKVRIYKACVRPIMTYSIETRADTAEAKRILRTTEKKALRSIAGKTLLDRIPNSQIRELCKVQDVVRWGRQRRRDWNQHVSRMDPQRLARIARDLKPLGKRPPGRPFNRWRDSWQSTSQLLLQN